MAPLYILGRDIAPRNTTISEIYQNREDKKGIPKEVHDLFGLNLIFRIAVRKEQFQNLHNAFQVMRIINDVDLIEKHVPELMQGRDKDHSSKLELELTEDDLWGDETEVGAPLNRAAACTAQPSFLRRPALVRRETEEEEGTSTAAEDCRRLSRFSSLWLNVDHNLLSPFKTSRCIATWSGISSKGFQDTPSNLRSVRHLTSSVITKVQSMPPKSYQVLADTPTNLSSAIHLTSSVSTKVQSTGGISSKGFQDTPSNFRSVGHLTSSVVTKVQSMPPISSQVLADTPTNLRAAINLTSSVSTKETRNPTNRVRSNVTIHPARNLEEEFSATLHDTSKVMEENGVFENIQDVDNVQSVSPQINTNVQTSSGVDINHTIVIPPAPDVAGNGERRRPVHGNRSSLAAAVPFIAHRSFPPVMHQSDRKSQTMIQSSSKSLGCQSTSSNQKLTGLSDLNQNFMLRRTTASRRSFATAPAATLTLDALPCRKEQRSPEEKTQLKDS
nr:replication factor A protein 1-like [Ipomoea batatas]